MIINDMPEKMGDFFNARADMYDMQQIRNIDGGGECYREIAGYIPPKTKKLLDLGSGTGLELESVFDRFPDADVTYIDMAEMMLEKITKKYPGRSINLVNGDYLVTDLGVRKYDAAISIMSFHHLTRFQKSKLYGAIFRCLVPDGVFIDCDYMIGSNDEDLERHFLNEKQRLASRYSLGDELYHCDVPFTVEHESSLLKEAGFRSVERVWGVGNNIMLLSVKSVS